MKNLKCFNGVKFQLVGKRFVFVGETQATYTHDMVEAGNAEIARANLGEGAAKALEEMDPKKVVDVFAEQKAAELKKVKAIDKKEGESDADAMARQQSEEEVLHAQEALVALEAAKADAVPKIEAARNTALGEIDQEARKSAEHMAPELEAAMTAEASKLVDGAENQSPTLNMKPLEMQNGLQYDKEGTKAVLIALLTQIIKYDGIDAGKAKMAELLKYSNERSNPIGVDGLNAAFPIKVMTPEGQWVDVGVFKYAQEQGIIQNDKDYPVALAAALAAKIYASHKIFEGYPKAVQAYQDFIKGKINRDSSFMTLHSTHNEEATKRLIDELEGPEAWAALAQSPDAIGASASIYETGTKSGSKQPDFDESELPGDEPAAAKEGPIVGPLASIGKGEIGGKSEMSPADVAAAKAKVDKDTKEATKAPAAVPGVKPAGVPAAKPSSKPANKPSVKTTPKDGFSHAVTIDDTAKEVDEQLADAEKAARDAEKNRAPVSEALGKFAKAATGFTDKLFTEGLFDEAPLRQGPAKIEKPKRVVTPPTNPVLAASGVDWGKTDGDTSALDAKNKAELEAKAKEAAKNDVTGRVKGIYYPSVDTHKDEE